MDDADQSTAITTAARQYFTTRDGLEAARAAASAGSKAFKLAESELAQLMVEEGLERITVGAKSVVLSRGLVVPKPPK